MRGVSGLDATRNGGGDRLHLITLIDPILRRRVLGLFVLFGFLVRAWGVRAKLGEGRDLKDLRDGAVRERVFVYVARGLVDRQFRVVDFLFSSFGCSIYWISDEFIAPTKLFDGKENMPDGSEDGTELDGGERERKSEGFKRDWV